MQNLNPNTDHLSFHVGFEVQKENRFSNQMVCNCIETAEIVARQLSQTRWGDCIIVHEGKVIANFISGQKQ